MLSASVPCPNLGNTPSVQNDVLVEKACTLNINDNQSVFVSPLFLSLPI